MATRNTDCSDKWPGILGIPELRQCAHFKRGVLRDPTFSLKEDTQPGFAEGLAMLEHQSHTEKGLVNPR